MLVRSYDNLTDAMQQFAAVTSASQLARTGRHTLPPLCREYAPPGYRNRYAAEKQPATAERACSAVRLPAEDLAGQPVGTHTLRPASSRCMAMHSCSRTEGRSCPHLLTVEQAFLTLEEAGRLVNKEERRHRYGVPTTLRVGPYH